MDWLTQSALDMASQNGGRMLPGIAFMHIPLPEYRKPRDSPVRLCLLCPLHPSLGALLKTSAASPQDDWRCFGMRKDGIATVDRSPPDALRSLSNANVQAVSVGHCHGNDECCTSSLEPWMPSLCFGRHSGLGGYNRGWEHGGRVFVLDSASPTKIATHVRLRDGSVVSSGVIGTANPLPHISTS